MRAERIMPEVIVLDVDEKFCNVYQKIVHDLGYTCATTNSTHDCLSSLNPGVKLLILDLNIPGTDGIEILRILAEERYKSSIIISTGCGEDIVIAAVNFAKKLDLNIVGATTKPFISADVEKLVLQALEPKTIAKESVTKDDAPLLITVQDMKNALSKNQFIVHYQPLLHIESKKVVGLEALVRWQHPIYGLIYPNCFISAAEEQGLIDDLGLAVMDICCSEYHEIAAEIGQSFQLSVNVSANSLKDLELPDKFALILHDNLLDSKNLTIEVTETRVIANASDALDILLRCRIKNMRLAIDDFGTGYANFELIKSIPATDIKIDKSIIDEIESNRQARVIIQNIVQMGHDLGYKVVAEGVETENQLRYVQSQKVDYVQGYYFSKPLSRNSIVEWIKEHNQKLSRES